MISVSRARQLILQNISALPGETVAVQDIPNRIAAADLIARRTQPPHNVSAMDGYAVASPDATVKNILKIVGEAPAGSPYTGTLQAGEAIRLFTGSIIPKGADHVIIQEDVSRRGDIITVIEKQTPPRHIRRAGIDFNLGRVLYTRGENLNAVHSAVLASAGLDVVPVHRQPRVAIFANGDELAEIGAPAKPTSIISSTPLALKNWLISWGAKPDYLGIASDNLENLTTMIQKARAKKVDVIVPLGGASVGDYDLVKTAFEHAGYDPIFSKVAVKPGKPTWFGTLDGINILGLPGNPASGLVSAQIFLRPLIEKLAGLNPSADLPLTQACLTDTLARNGSRELFSRSKTTFTKEAQLCVTPAPRQDSSLLTPFAQSNSFIYQSAGAPEKQPGELCDIFVWGQISDMFSRRD